MRPCSFLLTGLVDAVVAIVALSVPQFASAAEPAGPLPCAEPIERPLSGPLNDGWDPMDPNCGAGCLADLDGDFDVDLADLSSLLANYGLPSGAAPEDGDLDGDEDVDLADLAVLLSVFGTFCENEVFDRLFADPNAYEMSYWQTKPLAPVLVELPLQPVATDADRNAVALMMEGLFQPTYYYPPVDVGVPPPWDENPFGSNTWDLYRHALRWTEPLVKVWYADSDEECLALMQAIIQDWWEHNQVYPGASLYAWNDAATAWRLQRLVWFWELYRTNEIIDESFARVLLEMIYVHGAFCSEDRFYHPYSNHGLMLNTSLIELVTVCPEFCYAEDWRTIVSARIEQYTEDNFSPLGFHYEQTPLYHYYIVGRLAIIMLFLRDSEQPPVPTLDETTLAAASLMPCLVRPNRRVINVGDCKNNLLSDYFSSWAQWWDDGVLVPASSTLPNPREDDCQFVLDFDAGYAVFTTFPFNTTAPEPDTHILFKCNAFFFSHYHKDTLSFILYGMGHDWLTDSGGPYSYALCPERLYITSGRAHNLVLIDEAALDVGPAELIDYGRTDTVDFVSARHSPQGADHTRTLTFQPPYTIQIRDELVSTDDQAHIFTQVFHTLPTHTVEIVSDQRVHIIASDGKTCVIEQSGVAGQWQVITGQTVPYLQGWQTPDFEVFEPAPAIYFAPSETMYSCEFITTIWLSEVEP